MRISNAIHPFFDQVKVRELQQHVEEEEAGAIKWGDKMVRETLLLVLPFLNDPMHCNVNNWILPCPGHSSLPARERAGDGVGDGEKEAGRCQQIPQKSCQR